MNKRFRRYVLRGHTPVPCDSLRMWADERISSFDRWRVAVTYLDDERVTVSTVFLGIDHGWDGTRRSLLFETCVFVREGSGERSEVLNRYATWDEADEGHRLTVAMIQGAA